MAIEKCISVKIGYGESLDVLPNLRHIHICDSHGESYCVLYFEHIRQVVGLILALREMRKSFLNEIKQ